MLFLGVKKIQKHTFCLNLSIKEPNYLHEKTLHYVLNDAKKKMDELSEEEFEKLKQAAINELEEDFKTINSKAKFHWNQVLR